MPLPVEREHTTHKETSMSLWHEEGTGSHPAFPEMRQENVDLRSPTIKLLFVGSFWELLLLQKSWFLHSYLTIQILRLHTCWLTAVRNSVWEWAPHLKWRSQRSRTSRPFMGVSFQLGFQTQLFETWWKVCFANSWADPYVWLWCTAKADWPEYSYTTKALKRDQQDFNWRTTKLSHQKCNWEPLDKINVVGNENWNVGWQASVLNTGILNGQWKDYFGVFFKWSILIKNKWECGWALQGWGPRLRGAPVDARRMHWAEVILLGWPAGQQDTHDLFHLKNNISLVGENWIVTIAFVWQQE